MPCIINHDNKFFIVKKSIDKTSSSKEIVENQYSKKIIFHCDEITCENAFEIINLYKKSEQFIFNCSSVEFFKKNSLSQLKNILEHQKDIKNYFKCSIFSEFIGAVKNLHDFEKIMYEKNINNHVEHFHKKLFKI